MKFTSWPEPPIQKSYNPPEIPTKLRCFGLGYTVNNGNPKLDIPRKALDKDKMKECIENSFKLFLKALKTLDGSILNEIRDIHTHINEEINKAIAFEDEGGIKEAKNRKVSMKNEILDRIQRIIN
ncbi:uncharacterized protein VICG_01259 [Vittaforma corneae ATCC 50505]|uniref:Mediator of RNA polymerase II transcription subunit 7 n=1 Tax=Vittaforma corneae (strain ATCC 50505) TaxID=993615 RepID=L2GMN2_VITCO|nr:uncharacterized protein VICG_01259 [Vittaforma corneae ATCC 50505]ELA41755.1 hypothetical protein VICG_01259 [Vittaforma corneae ATCC 50505]